MKKWMTTLGIVFVIPAMTINADEQVTVSLSQAVEEIIENDLSLQIYEKDTVTLSSATRQYQADALEELEDLQEIQEDYAEKSTRWVIEYSAYSLLVQYKKATEALKIQQDNLSISKQELEKIEKKYREGIASEQNVVQAEVSVSNAELSLSSTQQQLNQLKFQLNQQLDNDLNTELSVKGVDDIKRLPPSEYEPKNLAEEMKQSHSSLIYYRTVVETYKDIVEDSEDLPVLGGSVFKETIEELTKYIAELEASLSNPPAGQTVEEIYIAIGKAKGDLESAEEAYDQAVKDRNRAEDDLVEYYEVEQLKAEIQLFDQYDKLELKSYNYAEQIEAFHKRLDLLEENVEKQEKLYEQQKARFDEGLLTATDLEKSRIGVLNAKIDLSNTQLDYTLLSEEFRMFKDGFLP
ncbi:TolC family protein [Bacillus sp. SCS-151]|uniref:TolC family protein n=1 Tax=Nanhaiella sioensis TaxID=3115293 RepID=UPI00397934AB